MIMMNWKAMGRMCFCSNWGILWSFLEETEENKKIRTSGVPVTISRIQLHRGEAAHTVQGGFVIISGLMLRTIMRN
jgi:hypothetical protein